MRRPKLQRGLQLRWRDVYSDDGRSARNVGSLDGRQSDAPGSEDGDGRARLHSSRAQRGPKPREDTAPNQGQRFERQLLVDLQHRALRDEHLLRKARDICELSHGRVALPEARRLIGRPGGSAFA